jgi:hypothetical protein
MITRLTPRMVRDVLDLLQAFRRGELSARPTGLRRGEMPLVQSAFGRLYMVVSVEGGGCSVAMPDEDGDPASGTELAGVLYDPDAVPAEGDLGQVLRLSNGSLYFHPGGGGVVRRLSLNGGLAADSIDIPATAKIGFIGLTVDANGEPVIDFTTECYEV